MVLHGESNIGHGVCMDVPMLQMGMWGVPLQRFVQNLVVRLVHVHGCNRHA